MLPVIAAVKDRKVVLQYESLIHDVEQRLSEQWKTLVVVDRYEQLSERISIVGRLHLTGKNLKSQTVIVKHVI